MAFLQSAPSSIGEASCSREHGDVLAGRRPGTSIPFVDPLLSVIEAPVTWLANSERPLMVARADRIGLAADADFRPESLTGLASIHIDAFGRQHVVIKSGSRRVTICIRGAAVAIAPARVTFEMTSLAGLFAAQRNVTALQELFDGKAAIQPAWTTTAEEKRDALIAFDAQCNGATHRDVARIIYGPKKVAAEWVSDGCDLKDYVRRCRSRGVRLMQGGYRRFLR